MIKDIDYGVEIEKLPNFTEILFRAEREEEDYTLSAGELILFEFQDPRLVKRIKNYEDVDDFPFVGVVMEDIVITSDEDDDALTDYIIRVGFGLRISWDSIVFHEDKERLKGVSGNLAMGMMLMGSVLDV